MAKWRRGKRCQGKASRGGIGPVFFDTTEEDLTKKFLMFCPTLAHPENNPTHDFVPSEDENADRQFLDGYALCAETRWRVTILELNQIVPVAGLVLLEDRFNGNTVWDGRFSFSESISELAQKIRAFALKHGALIDTERYAFSSRFIQQLLIELDKDDSVQRGGYYEYEDDETRYMPLITEWQL